MLYQQKSVQNLLAKLLQKTESQKKKLMDQLIYGKTMTHFNVYKYTQQQITLYLHENNPQILIALTNDGQSKPMDIRQTKFLNTNNQYKQLIELENKNYLIMEEQHEQIILIFGTEVARQQFKRNIKSVAKCIAEFPTDFDSSIIKNFIRADKNKNLELSHAQLFNLLQEIKLCEEDQIHDLKMYLKSEFSQEDKIGFRQFETIARILTCRRELIPIFQRYTQIKLTEHRSLFEKLMKYKDFSNFLRSEQQQTQQAADNICKLFFVHKNSRISFYDFCQFLTGSLNNIVNENYENFETPTDHPLHHYYCYSSHNTYLTGNQLTSDSKASRYYQDLENGIRCVEIDCHDGAYGPIVKHGYTVTSSITFENVIQEIEKFRKQNPRHTPIILSLENHCSNYNQYKMAGALDKHFGNSIVSICQYQQNKKILTLQQAIGKIIVKGSGNQLLYNQSLSKQDKYGQVQEEIQDEQSSDGDQEQSINGRDVEEIVEQKIDEEQFEKQKEVFFEKLEVLQQRKEKFESHRPEIAAFIKKYISHRQHKKSKNTINLKLLVLTAMLGSGIVGKPSPWESTSLSEKTILNYYYNNTEQKIKQHTKSGWIRVYPKATRFDSSNYNPLPALQLGAQIVALNTQVADYPAYLLHRFFEFGKNKITGYRLKPQLIDIPDNYKKIKITPLSAMKIYFNDSRFRRQMPICEIKMKYFGLSKDLKLNIQQKMWRSYTEGKKDNAFNPVFEKSHTMIIRYHSDDLSFIVVEVKGCGIAVLPVGYLRKGYRTATLYDQQMKPKDSKIIFLIQS